MKRGRERGSLPPGPRWPQCSLRSPQAVSLASRPHGTVSALSSFSAFALLDLLCVHWTFPASLECSALLVSAIPFPSSFFVSFPSLTLCPSITHFFLFLNINIPCSGSHIRVLCAPLTLSPVGKTGLGPGPVLGDFFLRWPKLAALHRRLPILHLRFVILYLQF